MYKDFWFTLSVMHSPEDGITGKEQKKVLYNVI